MSPVEITVVIIAAVIGVIALVMLIIVLAKLKALSRNNPNKPPKPAKPDFREMPVMPPQPQPVNNTPVPATAPSQPENIVPAPAAAPQADGFFAMLAANAKDFEGLYESLYVSCSDVGSFDADAYHEWCSRAAMSKDRSFAEAFARSFTDSEDTEHCKNSSVRLLGCISAAGIIRVSQAGIKLGPGQVDPELFTCLNAQNIQGRGCTVVKPAWVAGSKVIEPGVVMADNS